MLTTPLHPLAEDYLDRLREVAERLPRPDRDELVTELRSHIETGLPVGASDAEVRNLLRDLGTPEDIVAAAHTADPAGQAVAGPAWTAPEPASPWGPIEVIAVLGLTVGTVVLPLIGPILGITLAWISGQWTRREKVVATTLAALPLLALALGLAATMTVRVSDSGGGGDSVVNEPAVSVVEGGGS